MICSEYYRMSIEEGVSQKMIYWILGAVFALVITVILYSCCWVSGMADRQSEEYFQNGKFRQDACHSEDL